MTESLKKKGRAPGTASRTSIITVRLTPEIHAAAQLVGQVSCRTVSSLMEYALKLYIEKNYPDALKPGVKLSLSLSEAPSHPQVSEFLSIRGNAIPSTRN